MSDRPTGEPRSAVTGPVGILRTIIHDPVCGHDDGQGPFLWAA